eukprot:6070909-Pyramimonas_sp.AAC.1
MKVFPRSTLAWSAADRPWSPMTRSLDLRGGGPGDWWDVSRSGPRRAGDAKMHRQYSTTKNPATNQ